MHRNEKDLAGELRVPSEALYGIHSLRASLNFPVVSPFPESWYRAMGVVKLSSYSVYRRFRDSAQRRYPGSPGVMHIDDKILDAIEVSAGEVAAGDHFEHFIVPGLQGGAGTSINMNINEIIANSAIIRLGGRPGDYTLADPFDHCNIYQSTNDVVPTALTIAAMNQLNTLALSINNLRGSLEKVEREHRNSLRPGYTQMKEALPSSFGTLFSTYNEALSRDWWRVSKALERVRTINMGGGATGTGLAIPRFYIMEIVPELRRRTGLPLSRSENLPDATSMLDRWVEVHAIVKAHAVNLEKMVSDLRLLASDLLSPPQIELPVRQTGSSAMPGKVNPVIPEFVISATRKVYANDSLITSLAAMGQLELNAYIPLIGVSLLESLSLLEACNKSAATGMIEGIEIASGVAYERVIRSGTITTALIPFIGYRRASEIAIMMREKSITIFEANEIERFMEKERLEAVLTPANLLKLGYSLKEL